MTELERGILRQDEKRKTPDIEGSLEIAKEWLNSPQNKLHRFYAITKEMGEENLHKFLLIHGDEYADFYADLVNRGFQANTSRVVATLLKEFIQSRRERPNDLRILDMASGPEMLALHIDAKLQNQVFSFDRNKAHFNESKSGRAFVASFSNIPIQSGSMDYATLSLALHYSKFIPSRGKLERLNVFAEMNRVLKPGGRGIINLPYSMQFKDAKKFNKIVKALGFKVIKESTGDVTAGSHYHSHTVTLEKVRNLTGDVESIAKSLGRETLDGLKFRKTGISSLTNSKRVIKEFSLKKRKSAIDFNEEDKDLYKEEQNILRQGDALVAKYGSIKAIPLRELEIGDFLKVPRGSKYRLVKKSEKIGGFVDVR